MGLQWNNSRFRDYSQKGIHISEFHNCLHTEFFKFIISVCTKAEAKSSNAKAKGSTVMEQTLRSTEHYGHSSEMMLVQSIGKVNLGCHR